MSSTFHMLFCYFYKTNILFMCFFLVFYNNSTFITCIATQPINIAHSMQHTHQLLDEHTMHLLSFSLALTQQSWKDDIAPPLSTRNQRCRCRCKCRHKPDPDSNNGRTALPTSKRGNTDANPSDPDASDSDLFKEVEHHCIRSHERQCIA